MLKQVWLLVHEGLDGGSSFRVAADYEKAKEIFEALRVEHDLPITSVNDGVMKAEDVSGECVCAYLVDVEYSSIGIMAESIKKT